MFLIAGQVKIVKPFPQNIYPIEGEPASATCIAEGPHDKVQFVRRNQFGLFRKLAESDRVLTTNKTTGGRFHKFLQSCIEHYLVVQFL